jgi:SAM-dependent methyltransferase
VKSLEAKHLAVKLEYRTSPMETVDQAVAERIPFDAVFVVAALHHAFDWRQAVQAAYNCLKEGGWLVIANEPNALHVFLSYRLAKLGGRHEVGFTRTELVRRLRRTGFRKVVCLRNRASFYVRHHWLAARK